MLTILLFIFAAVSTIFVFIPSLRWTVSRPPSLELRCFFIDSDDLGDCLMALLERLEIPDLETSSKLK
jgi:hypothetical protein